MLFSSCIVLSLYWNGFEQLMHSDPKAELLPLKYYPLHLITQSQSLNSSTLSKFYDYYKYQLGYFFLYFFLKYF